MAFPPKNPPPLPGKQNQPPGPASIGKSVPGKLSKKQPPLRNAVVKKPTKAPPPRRADGGSASENNRLAKQVGDRLRARDKRQFPEEVE